MTPLRPCTTVSKTTASGADTHLDDVRGDGASGLVAVLHVAFEIHVEEFEDQIELLIRMHDIEEPAWQENKAWSVIERSKPISDTRTRHDAEVISMRREGRKFAGTMKRKKQRASEQGLRTRVRR